MIQAYRRGMLQPTLPFGSRSRMRETLMLELIESELEANSEINRAHAAAAIVGPANLSKAGRQSILSMFAGDLHRAELIRLMDFDRVFAQDPGNSALAIASVYDMLQQAGALSNEKADE